MNLYHFETACVSGAFSVLHPGVAELLDGAFRVAKRVLILVHDDELAQRTRGYVVPPLDVRIRQLERFLEARGYTGSFDIAVGREVYGEADVWLRPDIDCVVVSGEMFTAADLANRQRRRMGLPSFSIHVVQRRATPVHSA